MAPLQRRHAERRAVARSAKAGPAAIPTAGRWPAKGTAASLFAAAASSSSAAWATPRVGEAAAAFSPTAACAAWAWHAARPAVTIAAARRNAQGKSVLAPGSWTAFLRATACAGQVRRAAAARLVAATARGATAVLGWFAVATAPHSAASSKRRHPRVGVRAHE